MSLLYKIWLGTGKLWGVFELRLLILKKVFWLGTGKSDVFKTAPKEAEL